MRSFAALAFVMSLAAAAAATTPAAWTHSTEADLSAGKLDKTVVTSLGELTLAGALETVITPGDKLGVVSALAVGPDGKVYLAASPAAEIYRVGADTLAKIAKLPGALVRTLISEGDSLVAGTCGEGAGIYRVSLTGKVTKIWSEDDVKSVWAILPGPGKGYYAATGPEGRVYAITADGKSEIVYDGQDKNILSLVAGGRPGLLYAGTGENGLVVEIDAAVRTGRVLYDAAETEISVLLRDADGVLYAATSDSTKATGNGEAPSNDVKGKPDNGQATPAKPKPTSRPAATRQATPPTLPSKVVRRGPSRPPSMPSRKAKGNAVYRIEPSGATRAVFRRAVTILAMTLRDGTLTLGTGHGGQLFGIDLADDRITMLAKVDPKDVTAMVVDRAGKLYFGTADKAGVFALTGAKALMGTAISKVLDAREIASWGTIRVQADVPAGCGVTFAARSGNVAKAEDKTWSPWSAETPIADWPKIDAPPGRYLQYRLTLTGKADAAPTVEQVRLIYQVHNLPPSVSAVEVIASASSKPGPAKSGPKRYRVVQAKATDGNGDSLRYNFSFRRLGNALWIKLAAKQTKGLYVWDTLGLSDGTYEVRVEATDEATNSPTSALTDGRISRPVIVDNTPPRVAELAVKADGAGALKVSGKAVDATGRIVSIAYAVDSNDKWLAVPAADGIGDSPAESFAVELKDLDAGAHLVAVRVTDEYGNVGYASVEATVGE